MKKAGFTLAEVLITMTIIGVVAALTTPALLHNAATAEIGPKLAKFRTTVENANRLMMVANDVNRLSVLIRRAGAAEQNRTQRYTELLQNFMRLDGGADSYKVKAYTGDDDIQNVQVSLFANDHDANGPAQGDNLQANQIQVPLQDNDENATGFTFRTVEGMAVHFFLAPQVNGAGGVPTEPDNLGVILVDINGNAIPNSLGKDIFGFVLGNNGLLTPVGSRNVRSGNDNANEYDSSIWSISCPNNGNVTSQGLTCTGSIFANDLRVLYQ